MALMEPNDKAKSITAAGASFANPFFLYSMAVTTAGIISFGIATRKWQPQDGG